MKKTDTNCEKNDSAIRFVNSVYSKWTRKFKLFRTKNLGNVTVRLTLKITVAI